MLLEGAGGNQGGRTGAPDSSPLPQEGGAVLPLPGVAVLPGDRAGSEEEEEEEGSLWQGAAWDCGAELRAQGLVRVKCWYEMLQLNVLQQNQPGWDWCASLPGRIGPGFLGR